MNRDARVAIILLMKGIFYKSDNEIAFFELVGNSYGAISDYFKTIGLEVLVDENDGYAYLKNRVYEDESEVLPKLITSRELSYKVSLLCLILRKKIAQFDMQNENEKAIISGEEIFSNMSLYMDIQFNEVKAKREIEATIKKVEELGFLKKIRNSEDIYEIKSAIKSFVNVEFLDRLKEGLVVRG